MTTAHCASDLAEIQRLDGELAKVRKERDEAVDGREAGLVALESYRQTGKVWLATKVKLTAERDTARAECERLRIAVETLASCIYHDGHQWQFQQDATDEELRAAIGAAR